MKKSKFGASEVITRASAPKHRPISGITASAHNDSQDVDSPSPHTTSRMARPERKLLLAAQTSSAVTMSSSVIGAAMIASQVFCTCMREKPEYSASNVALFAVEKHSVPAAGEGVEGA